MVKRLLRRILGHYGYEIKNRKTNSRPNPYLNCTSWDYQSDYVSGLIQPTDIVLDIGSGNNPVPRANILADFFPDNDFHRSGAAVSDRPLVACSLERLPFLDKSIDFVICSHVFEHIDSPKRGGDELARIAHRGYIETPAYGKDILVGTGYMHKWQIVEFEGVAHFFEYSQRQTEAHVTSPMMDLWMSREHHPWQDFFWERQDLFNAMHFWIDSPQIMEYRRGAGAATQLSPWQPVDESSLPDQGVELSASEIELLAKCLATPTGDEPMFFNDRSFSNRDGSIKYPVRGKTVFCEVGTI